jgi:hypothetical protein
MADGQAAREAVSVVEQTWTDGARKAPSLDVLLSNSNVIRITVDGPYDLPTFRLFDEEGDLTGKLVFRWSTGIEVEQLDALIAEVRESNREWQADSDSTDFFYGSGL